MAACRKPVQAVAWRAPRQRRPPAPPKRLTWSAAAPGEGKGGVGGGPELPTVQGARFTIAGIGVTVRGAGKSGGTIRTAALIGTGKPGSLQIRLVDAAGQGTRDGLGACTGDSGGPVFEDQPSRPVIIGVVSRSTGP